MYSKAREKGILKLEPRPRPGIEPRAELIPQGSYERAPSSPHPSVDRLSVTWAEPTSMTSSAVNIYLPPENPINNESKFSPNPGELSEDEDYSASLSAVLRQRRASVRRSRKGRARRPSSPSLPEEPRRDQIRRRSSVFTTSSGDTAISMDEVVSQEQIFENIHLHKEVLGSVKQHPFEMRKKLKIVNQAKTYIKRHEGQLQERLAQSKSTRDIYARFNIWMTTKWQQMKREAANTSNLMIPWELRIKEIESHFGSVVASYFTFLRWLFWVNLVIAFILLVFVIVPEYLTANPTEDGERKVIMEEEQRNATNLLTLWEFEGVLKCSPIFYGYYSNVERPEYRMPLAYFLTGLVVYIYSFVAILRKMAENSRMSKLSEKGDECIFSWKLFTGWDFMIGNTETASNRMASIILSFKEALLEEAEKKKDLRNWRIISLRALVNTCVVILLAVSAYAVVTVVSRSDDNIKVSSWWRENETTVVVTVISITFPVLFELLGFLEHYHPRKQLRLQLARIMLLNLLNLYSLMFALCSKIDGMSKDLDSLKPTLNINATTLSNNINESYPTDSPQICTEELIPCLPCNIMFALAINSTLDHIYTNKSLVHQHDRKTPWTLVAETTTTENTVNYPHTANSVYVIPENLVELTRSEISTSDTEFSTENNNFSDVYYKDDLENDDSFGSSTTVDTTLNELSTELKSESSPEISNVTASTPTLYKDTINSYTHEDTTLTKNMETDLTDFFSSSTDVYHDTTETNEDTNANDKTSLYKDTIVMNSFTTDKRSLTETTFFYQDYMTSTFGNLPAIATESPTEITDSEITSTPNVDLTTTKQASQEYNSNISTMCPNITINCSVKCDGKNITQIFSIYNCTKLTQTCFVRRCIKANSHLNSKPHINSTDSVEKDFATLDHRNRTTYNLTKSTKKRLLKLCWETMFGQELIKLTMMDLVFVLLGTLFMDFLRALFVRYFNKCWCWDLEKKFPEYGDFKIAENILHLINNQGMVWMGMFFSPGLVVLNVVKLMIMMYLRSWAVMTCNVPHEVVFRVSKSNNFYLALLLTMLFLCVLPVGYTIVWVKPSWHCGPFSEYERIYYILTSNIYKILPKSLNFTLMYITSPAIVIPLLVLLILIIYYLISLTNSLREANNDLKIQLRRERTEERRKMFQIADTRRRVGSSAMDNTPFARWKKALPSLPLSKSIDSDDRKNSTNEDGTEPTKSTKKKGNIFAKIVNMALDKKTDVEVIKEVQTTISMNNGDEETDTDFHETLPSELLKIKDINVPLKHGTKKKSNVEFKTNQSETNIQHQPEDSFLVKTRKKANVNILENSNERAKSKPIVVECTTKKSKLKRNQTSESSTQSKQSDSISSIIPVITISTTESDDEILQSSKIKQDKGIQSVQDKDPLADQEQATPSKKSKFELKSLRRQSSVDSVSKKKSVKEKQPDDGPKYQYSL